MPKRLGPCPAREIVELESLPIRLITPLPIYSTEWRKSQTNLERTDGPVRNSFRTLPKAIDGRRCFSKLNRELMHVYLRMGDLGYHGTDRLVF